MVGTIAAAAREKTASLINSAKLASDIPSKLAHLHRLSVELSDVDAAFLSAFLPSLLDLVSDGFSPVRKYIIEMIGHVGLKHFQLLPEIVPVFITLLTDDTPAVARQTIKCAIDIFRSTLVRVAVQGMYSSELDESLESSLSWVQKLRNEVYSLAFQPASDGRRLLALKFVESVVLLYTPDPNNSPEPASDLNSEGISKEFNISWLRGGHPTLNVGDLSIEASRSLGQLLDQLRLPTVKSLSNLMIIVLVKGLSTIAKKRPSFYGRILPVLLGLDRSSSAGNGVHRALKNAFVSCLNCTHSGAAPWKDRLVVALREIDDGGLVDKVLPVATQDSGNVELKNDSSVTQDEKPSTELFDDAHTIGKKRTGLEDNNDLIDDEISGKRLRPMPAASEGTTKELSGEKERVSPSGATTSRSDGDNGPVQQLVAMFGALVAQGEKAVVSLEILISSISADLLAEVVMANMRNLPPNRPKAEDDEEVLNLGSHSSMVGSDDQFKHLSSLLTDILSGSSSSQQENTEIDTQHSLPIEPEPERRDENVPVNQESELAAAPLGVSVPSEDAPLVMEDSCSVVASEVIEVGNLDDEIPGLDISAGGDGLQNALVLSSLGSTNLEDASLEHVTTSSRSLLESHPSMSTDRSEELSPKAAVMEVTSTSSSMSMSLGASRPLLLPKMSAPVIHLTDEQKDDLQKSAFMRIIDAYKQIAISGGSQVRSSILANLGFEFPLELDPWKLLQTHILSDYINLEGHELTLRVLYRLFGEAEEERDFFSSTTATSVYETFLLVVAETLRDSFPASDKSLSRLLCEVPSLPKSILKLLECMCSPGTGDKDEKELHSGDRVTQGLSTVWNLILLRPPIRDSCLKIALQSAVHHLEEVRMKAIRLVANKLYPLSSISQQIEDFAKEMLVSVANVDQTTDLGDADGTDTELNKDANTEISVSEHPTGTAVTKDTSSDTHQSSTSESVPSSAIAEVQRCMSLYFALCTKKHALFHQILVIYKSTSKAVKQAFHRQIPMLVRTIGASSELLGIISDPPSGSENLLMQVLQTLTDGIVPSPELLSTIRKLYDMKLKDVDILIPVLPFLSKDEVLLIFPQLVNVPLDKFQVVLSRVLQGASHSGPVLTPAEALIAIHGIDPDKDGIPLKKVTDACNACFEQREIFTQQVLAKVLNQLVEQIPLPLLFMRTVLQAIGAFPSLVDFIMEILSRLVNKQIWKYPKLWVGFVKCALLTKPQSFGVLLQLPPTQLENALHRTPALKVPLAAHASQPHIRSSLPRSVLVVLGIVSDSQSSSHTQTTQALGDTGTSDKEAVTERSKESSSAS